MTTKYPREVNSALQPLEVDNISSDQTFTVTFELIFFSSYECTDVPQFIFFVKCPRTRRWALFKDDYRQHKVSNRNCGSQTVPFLSPLFVKRSGFQYYKERVFRHEASRYRMIFHSGKNNYFMYRFEPIVSQSEGDINLKADQCHSKSASRCCECVTE